MLKPFSIKVKIVKIFFRRTFLKPLFGMFFWLWIFCYINGSEYTDSTNSFYIKFNAKQILKNQFKQKLKSGERDVLLIGSATDPYIDIEKELF